MNLLLAAKNRLAHWREWELNPIVVKELRQAVRSWAVTGTLFLFLLLLFSTALLILLAQSFGSEINPMIGNVIFRAFSGILTFASVVFIPLYVAARLGAERHPSNIDLLYTTALTPGQIIRGKLFCGAYIAVLFFSACMPFMAFTNLLRGVDLPTIFFNLFVLFLIVCLVVQLGIFFACLGISRPFKILLGIFGGIGVLSMGGPLFMLFVEFRSSGVGAMMGEAQFWQVFLTSLSIGLAVLCLLYFLSVAMITPVSANRALPLRLCLTALWFLSGVLSLVWVYKAGEPRLIFPWAITSFIVLLAALAVVVSSEDQLSPRVLRAIPTSPWRRALAFFFYNGAAGGLLWLALLIGLTCLAASACLDPAHLLLPAKARHGFGLLPISPGDYQHWKVSNGSLLLYSFAYSLAALWIHRTWLKRRPAKLAGILAVLIPAAWAILPAVVLFLFNRLSWKSLEAFQPGNLFNAFALQNDSRQFLHLFISGGLLALMLLLNAGWFVRQVKHFRRYEPCLVPPPVIQTPPGNLNPA